MLLRLIILYEQECLVLFMSRLFDIMLTLAFIVSVILSIMSGLYCDRYCFISSHRLHTNIQ